MCILIHIIQKVLLILEVPFKCESSFTSEPEVLLLDADGISLNSESYL